MWLKIINKVRTLAQWNKTNQGNPREHVEPSQVFRDRGAERGSACHQQKGYRELFTSEEVKTVTDEETRTEGEKVSERANVSQNRSSILTFNVIAIFEQVLGESDEHCSLHDHDEAAEE